MRDPDSSDPAATGQSGRGRTILEFTLEHGLRPARHSESARKDHDWRSGSLHADRADARPAGIHRLAFGIGVGSACGTRSKPKPNTGTAVRATRDITGRASGVARG